MPVPTSLDHLVYATPDLEQGIRRITEALGHAPLAGGSHPAWGTRNALVPLSPVTYLEIIGPDPASFEASRPPLFGLDTLRAPRLVTWAAKGRRLADLVARAQAFGIQLGLPTIGSRRTADGSTLTWELTDPLRPVADGLIPFFIDWGTGPHPATMEPARVTLVHLQGSHPNAELVVRALRRLDLDLDVRAGSRPGLRATFKTPRGQVSLE